MSESLHVVCPHCDKTNRVPRDRTTAAPKCGHCHQGLFSGQITELTTANFQHFIERHDIPVVVDFWAPWCGPCQMMAPHYAEAAKEIEPRARLAKVNTESEPQLAARFGIRSIPTLTLFKAGREVSRQAGALGRADIIRWVESHS